jgi:NAD-dependent deacetylase
MGAVQITAYQKCSSVEQEFMNSGGTMIGTILGGLRQRRRSDVTEDLYEQVCDLLLTSRRTVVLTGAGISTRSGIPDFRSPESGIWKHADPLDVASIWGFREHPEHFYQWIRPLAQKMAVAEPNPAHRALASLEAQGLLDLIITQNIDNLHQRAGSSRVVHVHGSTEGATCLACHYQERDPHFWDGFIYGKDDGAMPRCPQCRTVLKPNVVLFGEDLPHEDLVHAQQAALHCDLMLAVGTSLEVMPAADLPLLAKRRGARLVILNLSGTLADHKADLIVREDLVLSLPRIAERCQARQK